MLFPLSGRLQRLTGIAKHLQVKSNKPPSPPSEASSLQSPPPVHSSFLTWQRPHHAHSSVFNTAYSSEVVTGTVDLDSNRAAVATLESKLLQAMDLEALNGGYSGERRDGQEAGDAGGIVADTEQLSQDQHMVEWEAHTSTQDPADRAPEASAALPLVCLHGDETKQLPAAHGKGVRVAEESRIPLSDELAEAEWAEEVGPALFWQAPIAETESPCPEAHSGTARGAHRASAPWSPAGVTAAEHAADADTADQASIPFSASGTPSGHASPLYSAEASLQHDLAAALPGVHGGTRSMLLKEALTSPVPHHRSDLKALTLGRNEAYAPTFSAVVACGSSPDQAVAVPASSVACGCGTRHCLGIRRRPRAKLSRLRRTHQEPRASPLKRDHDADILAALLALQMTVSGHSAAILQLKQASRPQSCCTPPASPTQPRGLLQARLDVAWSGESSRGASSGLPSHNSAAALPDSKRHVLGALAVETEQELPQQHSLAAATNGSSGSIPSAGRAAQAGRIKLSHTTIAIPKVLPSAAAGALRAAPSISATLGIQERAGMKQGAKHDPVSFNRVLQHWHKERRVQAGARR